MLSCVINPSAHKGDPRLPPTGILAVNPSDSSCLAEFSKHYQLRQHFLFNSRLYSNDFLFLAGPAVGAPMAALCLEKLIALGARNIVVYGWCGSLSPFLAAGDLFLPTSGLSEEGTSGHYPVPKDRQEDSLFHRSLLQQLQHHGHNPQQGSIWTIDAVYRETREKVERYAAQGILAVDMEYTALRTVAAFRQVDLAAVMLVSDELFHHPWTPKFSQKRFRTASATILAELCTLVQSGELQ
ncbi:purine or other phosphorylase family 1 [Desulfobulbus propionicus DSM 2032]|jgi:uridine phosphorylase|uniref:Uridine phosphorylase n=1 Tax=Desulfobulbus propionicus (strain ATCC 33891 / DSM 2032 / VKM B-1956 / 1pr3) TaxID=577650 RepID=A0A7U4DQD1_DESPD|nr:nucleoside phosphorylase [Desulfobulbus propionicus]ADW19096.1 purine or other phosphorylase family 1 [Desulfobulbus propionicus DSM 2032]